MKWQWISSISDLYKSFIDIDFIKQVIVFYMEIVYSRRSAVTHIDRNAWRRGWLWSEMGMNYFEM